jgi:RNA polymerase sigma-70 factor (ECF subfamily)
MTSFSKENNFSIFKQIMQRYQGLVWNIAFRYTADTDDSKDIVQDTFIRLIEAAPRYKPTASLSTFIYHIVTNLCLDFKKKKRPVPLDTLELTADDTTEDCDEKLDSDARKAHLTHALHNLPARQRLAIIYKYDHDLSIRDIADIMKTTEKSVERLLYHGRENLKKKMEKKY